MIGDILFFIKTIVMTLVVVVLLQVKIGEFTLEQRATQWARQSSVAKPIQDVAHGGLLALRDGWRHFYSLFSGEVQKVIGSDEAPGKRNLGITFERSKKYFEEKSEKAKKIAQRKAAEAKRIATERAQEAKELAKQKAHQATEEMTDELLNTFDADSEEEK
tara:strand:+ start:14237 stop:14719 length:483 start_codon:yes stop_codon:yes gene_type:complete